MGSAQGQGQQGRAHQARQRRTCEHFACVRTHLGPPWSGAAAPAAAMLAVKGAGAAGEPRPWRRRRSRAAAATPGAARAAALQVGPVELQVAADLAQPAHQRQQLRCRRRLALGRQHQLHCPQAHPLRLGVVAGSAAGAEGCILLAAPGRGQQAQALHRLPQRAWHTAAIAGQHRLGALGCCHSVIGCCCRRTATTADRARMVGANQLLPLHAC